MNYLLSIFVFSVVLFLYIHIQFQLKTSNDLEVYNIIKPSKDRLEEICDIRQPVIFRFGNEELEEKINLETLQNEHGIFDLKVRNIENNDRDSELYLPFPLNEAKKLFEGDKNGIYYSENNNDFLNETNLIKTFRQNDSFLRPSMVSKCSYDILSGSENCKTPLRYNLEYRNYFYLTSGEVRLKLIPPDSGKFLHCSKDYDNYEFSSPINPWNIQDKYSVDFQKVKVLDIKLEKGDIIYIPAYWWYSIEYKKNSTLTNFRYRTYMNTITILPDLIIWFLQKQNTKFEIIKKNSI